MIPRLLKYVNSTPIYVTFKHSLIAHIPSSTPSFILKRSMAYFMLLK